MPPDLRNLPDPVRERLGRFFDDRGDSRYRSGFDVAQQGRLLEARAVRIGEGVTVRSTDDGDPVLDGYATVYEYPYAVAGGPPWGWIETMAGGSAAKTVRERDDVRLLFNHDGIPLARTKSNTLSLESDGVGVRVHTPHGLDRSSPLVQSLASAMDRGDLDEMSVAMRVIRQEWNEDYTERRILEVQLYDVSVVTFPANPATVAQLRDGGPPTVRRGLHIGLARAQADALRIAG